MIDPTQQAAAAPGSASAAAPGAASGAAGGTVVCIADQGDGTFAVYQEGQDASSGQTFQDVDQALEAAETMLTGQSDQDGDQGSAAQADALFQSGFNGVRGK